MKDRIRTIRKNEKMTQGEFAKSLNLTQNYISLVETGVRTLSERAILDICRKFGINYNWLVSGKGEMYQYDEDDIQAMIDSIIQGDNDFAKKTIIAFAKLDMKEWEIIAKIVKSIASELGE